MSNFDDLFNGQPAQASAATFDKDAWAAKKKAERDSVFARIDEFALKMAGNGSLFRTFLDVQARFDRYSVSNAILIADQMPQATRLADFETWKASGVYVARGAASLTILEPGKEYQKEDGSTGVFYNPKKVFDISQTNSRQQAAPAVARDERLLLKALMNNAPCRFVISDTLPAGRYAMYQEAENMIQIRRGMDAPTIFRNLSQELARAHIAMNGGECAYPDFTAYSVAYLLCKRGGVSVEGFSFEQMPEGYRSMDAQAVRSEASTMRSIANAITADMDRLFAAQEKAPKARDDAR